jgi:hypothetical protein
VCGASRRQVKSRPILERCWENGERRQEVGEEEKVNEPRVSTMIRRSICEPAPKILSVSHSTHNHNLEVHVQNTALGRTFIARPKTMDTPNPRA